MKAVREGDGREDENARTCYAGSESTICSMSRMLSRAR